jgi:hypothetical protein
MTIMPGHNPLGTPYGIAPALQKSVVSFYEAHGALPVLALVPRELRPGEVLSWSAYLGLADVLPGLPGCPGSAPVLSTPKAEEPVTKIGPPRHRGRPPLEVSSDLVQGPGSLRKKAGRAGVSYGTIRRRLAAHRQGRGS